MKYVDRVAELCGRKREADMEEILNEAKGGGRDAVRRAGGENRVEGIRRMAVDY